MIADKYAAVLEEGLTLSVKERLRLAQALTASVEEMLPAEGVQISSKSTLLPGVEPVDESLNIANDDDETPLDTTPRPGETIVRLIQEAEMWRHFDGPEDPVEWVTMNDCLIASVCARLRLPLYTHNTRVMQILVGDLAVKPY